MAGLAGVLALASWPACRPAEKTAAPAEPAPEPIVLRPHQPVAREMRGGELHAYQIALAAGDYLHLVVDQQALDVVATLLSPRGETLIVVDGMTGANGPETVLWLAAEQGSHRLEISPLGNEAEPGHYQLEIVRLQAATEADRRRAAAARALAEADALRRLNRPDAWPRAIRRYQDALARWQEVGHPARQAEILIQLGILAEKLDDRRQALIYYERALPLGAALDVPQQASTLHRLGRTCYYLGRLEEARDYYRQALPLRRQVGDRAGEALTANNLGLVYRILGEPHRALILYEQVIALWQEVGNRKEEALALHNRGMCYLFLGEEEQAYGDLTQALAIQEELGNRSRQALALIGLGQLHQGRDGDRDKQRALVCYERALELWKKVGDRRGQAVALNRIGVVLVETAPALTAREYFDQALTIFRSLGDRRQEATVLHNIGWLHCLLEQPAEAAPYLRQALSLHEEIPGATVEMTTLRYLATVERRLGNLGEARKLIERALDQIEDVRARPASHGLRSSYFATKQQYYGFYVDLLMELHRTDPEAGHDGEALAASERARARSLLETLIESDANLRRGADPALREMERALEEQINAKELQRLKLLEGHPTAEQLATLEQSLRQLLREYEKVRGQIRVSSPRYAALTQPRPLGAREIQRQVPDPETLLLQYHLGEERSYLWAVDVDSISSFELPPRAEIERLARRAYQLLASSNRRQAAAPTRIVLARLSEMLLRPVAERLGSKRLLIVADGALQYVPFAALPIPPPVHPAATGPPGPATWAGALILEHEISTMPSASALAVLRRQVAGRRPAAGTVAVVADPVFQRHDPRFRATADRDPHSPAARASARSPSGAGDAVSAPDLKRFERLVYARQEADAIRELAPAGSLVALGFEASRERVIRGDLAGYRIVHFATHGDLNAEHPGLSRLVLSLLDEQGRPRDGLLHAHEIYNLELPAELVVLSGCQTALGREIRGEGLVGLTQGFMYAGAARVIVSLWHVNDQATAELMARFYRQLLGRGRKPASALRRAQVSIAQEKRWQAPYYWAGFVLQGEW